MYHLLTLKTGSVELWTQEVPAPLRGLVTLAVSPETGSEAVIADLIVVVIEYSKCGTEIRHFIQISVISH